MTEMLLRFSGMCGKKNVSKRGRGLVVLGGEGLIPGGQVEGEVPSLEGRPGRPERKHGRLTIGPKTRDPNAGGQLRPFGRGNQTRGQCGAEDNARENLTCGGEIKGSINQKSEFPVWGP